LPQKRPRPPNKNIDKDQDSDHYGEADPGALLKSQETRRSRRMLHNTTSTLRHN
jgi:hypothetical protein